MKKIWCYLFFRRLKGGSIEPHPTENALIINYTLEATVFNEPGDAMLEKSKVHLLLFLFVFVVLFHFCNHIFFCHSLQLRICIV